MRFAGAACFKETEATSVSLITLLKSLYKRVSTKKGEGREPKRLQSGQQVLANLNALQFLPVDAAEHIHFFAGFGAAVMHQKGCFGLADFALLDALQAGQTDAGVHGVDIAAG